MLVSGGHSSLLEVTDVTVGVEPMGSTIDDAAGEAFDKVARLLGLPFPGGPHIDKAARSGNSVAIDFPRGLTSRRLAPLAAVLGALMAALGGAFLLLPGQGLGLGFTALFFVVAGLALLTPMGALLVTTLVRPLLTRVSDALGLVATRGVARSLGRTAPAIAALSVAVSVTVGLGIYQRRRRPTQNQRCVSRLPAPVTAGVMVGACLLSR